MELKVLLQRSCKELPCILIERQATRHKHSKGWRPALDLSDIPNPGQGTTQCTIPLVPHDYLQPAMLILGRLKHISQQFLTCTGLRCSAYTCDDTPYCTNNNVTDLHPSPPASRPGLMQLRPAYSQVKTELASNLNKRQVGLRLLGMQCSYCKEHCGCLQASQLAHVHIVESHLFTPRVEAGGGDALVPDIIQLHCSREQFLCALPSLG